MKWIFFLTSLFACGQADAQGHFTALMDPPAWVLKPTPAIDCNFALGAYYNCPLDKTFSVTRASTKYCQWQSQVWMSVASGAPCITDQGWLIEEARTNLALWARDMTQSGTWIAVTMTAALNAVGIDGTANSATTLTSTSPAGTILQSLTAASTAYTYTVFVKGVTVTGAIQVADYPVLTPAFTTLTSSNCFNPVTGVGTAPASGQTIFVRCTITATSLNPVIGFKFANNGDSIIVDFNQLEAASFGTSPILTTSASATRAADAITVGSVLNSNLNGNQVSIVAAIGPISTNAANGVLGNSANIMLYVTSLTKVGTRWNSGNANLVGTNSLISTTSHRLGMSGNSVGRTVVADGGPVATDTNAINAPASAVTLGSQSGGNFVDGLIQRITVFPFRMNDAQLQMLTSLN